MRAVEAVRKQHRPQRITVLFVGEFPPSNGKFFYCGDNDLLRHMRSAMGATSGNDAAFLNEFRKRGWFLDDIVTKPIHNLSRAERERERRDARADLAARIVEEVKAACDRFHPLQDQGRRGDRSKQGGQRRQPVRRAFPRPWASESFRRNDGRYPAEAA